MAASFDIIYRFPGSGVPLQLPLTDGVFDVLSVDSLGRLFGTSIPDGAFMLSQGPNKAVWSEHTVYLFNSQPTSYSPSQPEGGVTLVGSAIFGTTLTGGVGHGFLTNYGLGVAYRLNSGPLGVSLTQLHDFEGTMVSPSDGIYPESGMTVGLGGYLYGTTMQGNLDGPATIFALSPSATKPGYQVIHRFGAPGDQATPTHGRLWADSQGRLFGDSQDGGANFAGEVYMLTDTGGKWQEQVIYSFLPYPEAALRAPAANVVMDSHGNVYGCADAGTHNQGGIFELTPPQEQGGAWAETTLYNFGDAPHDPIAVGTITFSVGCGIAIDPATNILYGTSYGGGEYGFGTVYSLTPPQAGQTAWTEVIIHSFRGNENDGEYPVAPPLNVGGTYYGTNLSRIVYSFTP